MIIPADLSEFVIYADDGNMLRMRHATCGWDSDYCLDLELGEWVDMADRHRCSVMVVEGELAPKAIAG